MPTATLAAEPNFLVPNGTILVELVLFLIIFGVLGRVVLPAIQRAATERRASIQAQFDEAVEAKERAEEAEAAYQAALDETRAKATQIREEARAKGRQLLDDARAKAQDEADRELVHGRQHLAAERDALVRDLQAGVGALGLALAGRIVGEPLEADAQQAGWVEEFLSREQEKAAGVPVTSKAGDSA